jgi:hypothetical protein
MPSAIAQPLLFSYLQIDPMWYDLNPGGWPLEFPEYLDFIFIDLEAGIQESSAVNYGDIQVIGRAESYKTYLGTANKEIPLTFKFTAQGRQAFNIYTDVLREEVVMPAMWLDALKYPYVGPDGLSHAPPRCFLQIGELFAGSVIATDVQITWQPPFDPDTMLPHGADVSCTFTVVRAFPAYFPTDNWWW